MNEILNCQNLKAKDPQAVEIRVVKAYAVTAFDVL